MTPWQQAPVRTAWWWRLLDRGGAARRRRRIAHELYLRAVAQARQPVFFADWGVPDTKDGRFEMIGLHVMLVTRRLRRAGADGALLARELLEVMIADLDRSLRELGVGDLSVGRQVQQLIASFLARGAAIEPGLDGQDAAPIRTALERNLYQSGVPAAPAQVDALARYLLRQEAVLDRQAGAELLAGHVAFDRPEGVAPVRPSGG